MLLLKAVTARLLQANEGYASLGQGLRYHRGVFCLAAPRR
jgi:hypothetical protein